MAYKEIETKQFNVWNKKGALSAGDTLEGTYTGKRSFTTKYGEAISYIVEKDNGEVMEIIGQADIKNKFDQIPENSKVKVEYVGLTETENGTMKTYKVLFDDGE